MIYVIPLLQFMLQLEPSYFLLADIRLHRCTYMARAPYCTSAGWSRPAEAMEVCHQEGAKFYIALDTGTGGR